MDVQNPQKPLEATGLWLLKLITGLFIIIFIIIHFIVNHLVATGGLLTYADVIQYYQNPLIPIMEALFLVFVVAHCLLGLRGIILDLKISRPGMRIVDSTLIIIGIFAVVYGIWLLCTVVARGTT